MLRKPECSPSVFAPDIPDAEWHNYYTAEFSPPDPLLESKFESDLEELLNRPQCPFDDIVVTASVVESAIKN